MKKRTFPRAAAYAGCVILALTTVALSQNSEPAVEVRHDPKDSKAVPIIEEKEPSVKFFLEAGYLTQYNFRGTNLLPNADGAFFSQAQATIPKVGPGSLSFGVWSIHQLGDAIAPTWSLSEGGGGSLSGPTQAIRCLTCDVETVTVQTLPTTTQTEFNEWDLFVSYKFALGPVDVTVGNILFLIRREATTSQVRALPEGFFFTNPPTFSRFATYNNVPTVQDEQFDRIYVRLSTDKIPHITPSIVYYQTIYSEGDDPAGNIQVFNGNPFLILQNVETGRDIAFTPHGPKRNSELGGYAEARLNGNFPVGSWLDINPYGVIAYSFDDRTEPAAGTFAGRPFTGWNHAQAGLELVFHVNSHIAIIPQAVYSHHISTPPIGTEKNEFFGGVKVAVTLW